MGANSSNLVLTKKGIVNKNDMLLKHTGLNITIAEKKFEKPLTVQEVIKEFFKTTENEGKIHYICSELLQLNLDEKYSGTEEFSVGVYENSLYLFLSEIDQEKSRLKIQNKLNLLQAALVIDGLVDNLDKGCLKNFNTIMIDCVEEIQKTNIKISIHIYQPNNYHIYMYSSLSKDDKYSVGTGFVCK